VVLHQLSDWQLHSSSQAVALGVNVQHAAELEPIDFAGGGVRGYTGKWCVQQREQRRPGSCF
jgi:hypothetical protein